LGISAGLASSFSTTYHNIIPSPVGCSSVSTLEIMSSDPRKDSSSSFKVVSKPSLQISPNLEALLQHDELTRRGSPTNLYHPISGFSISLPPPPPRNPTKKPPHAETRVNVKEIRRKKSVNGINVRSDSWPDALPSWSIPAGHSSPSPTSSRSATPNPYINPTPTINTSDYPGEAGQRFLLLLSLKITSVNSHAFQQLHHSS